MATSAKRPRPRRTPIGAVIGLCVFLAGVLAIFGYVNYRAWVAPFGPVFPVAEKPFIPKDPANVPAADVFSVNNGTVQKPPPEPSEAGVRQWRKLTENNPFQTPPNAPRRHNSDELLRAVDAAFAEPAVELKPAVVFFPVVDGGGKVQTDGFVISQMAALAAAYTPHHRLALSMPHQRDELLVARCQKVGEIIDANKIALATAALDTKLYVLPHMDSSRDKHVLTVEFHGDGNKFADQTYRHDIGVDEKRTAPGLVAKDVLDAVGVRMDSEEQQRVLAPTVRNEHAFEYLAQVLNIYPASGSEDAWLANFLTVNPGCTLAWEQWLRNGPNADVANRLQTFTKASPSCDRLQIEAARLQRNSGQPEEALLALLKLAPSHHGDSGYFATLARCAVVLEDQRLFDRIFELWEKDGPGYSGYLARGGELTEWAWKARGGSWANTVSDKGWQLFHERLTRAQEELEHAVEDDPTGYRAHTGLMRVARGLELPRAYMERHFRAAVRAQPRMLLAYSEKAEYLLPRWHGNQEELLSFGKECLATDAWDDDIPQLCLSTIRLACDDMPDDALAAALREGPVWDLLRSYYEGALKHRHSEVADYTDNLFARLATLGGHFEEAASAIQKIGTTHYGDLEVFVDDSEYEFFCDLVHAHTGKLPIRPDGRKRDRALAQASAALAIDNLDDAEKALAQVEKGDAETDRLVERYRGAVALGRKLQEDGGVTLSPQQVKDLCLMSGQELWSVEEDKLTGRKLTGQTSLSPPLGLEHAVVTGVLSWEGSVSAVEMQLHARAPRHKERMVFEPAKGTVSLLSDSKFLTMAPYLPGPLKFRFDLGADQERLEPCSTAHWRLPAVDLPGGFALQIWNEKNDATVSISDLRIELKK